MTAFANSISNKAAGQAPSDTMLPETREALETSIAYWGCIVTGDAGSLGTATCALCQRFRDSSARNCEIKETGEVCPVKMRTGKPTCDDSPYDAFTAAQDFPGLENEGPVSYRQSPEGENLGLWVNTAEGVTLAQAEQAFLISLRPKAQPTNSEPIAPPATARLHTEYGAKLSARYSSGHNSYHISTCSLDLLPEDPVFNELAWSFKADDCVEAAQFFLDRANDLEPSAPPHTIEKPLTKPPCGMVADGADWEYVSPTSARFNARRLSDGEYRLSLGRLDDAGTRSSWIIRPEDIPSIKAFFQYLGQTFNTTD